LPKLPTQDLLKECYFDDSDGTFAKTNPASVKDYDVTRKNGFECGEFNCLPIESFCDDGWNAFEDFPAQKLCPGFHILIMKRMNYMNNLHDGLVLFWIC
jgi:hypothetical protein